MTLDEAIQHCEEVADDYEIMMKRCDDASGYSRYKNEKIRTEEAKKCEECASDHRQLAEWLKKLQTYEEGIERIKEQVNNFKGCDMWDTANGMELALELFEEGNGNDSN